MKSVLWRTTRQHPISLSTLTTCLQIKSTTGLFYKHKAHYHKVELVNQVLSVGMLQLTTIL